MIPLDQLVHVGRRVLVELLVRAKDEDGDIDGAEDGKFVRLLEEAALALEEGAAMRDGSAWFGRGETGLEPTRSDSCHP